MTYFVPSDDDLAALAAFAPELGNALRDVGFSTDGLHQVLGKAGMAALDRGEPAAVAAAIKQFHQRQAKDSYQAATNTPGAHQQLPLALEGLLLRTPIDWHEVFPDALVAQLESAHIIHEGAITVDIRPIQLSTDTPEVNHDFLIFSDFDSSMDQRIPGLNHVLGVGRASRSLLDITPKDPVESIFDLGGGCGVQALGQTASKHITLSDIHPRAIVFSRITMLANGLGKKLDDGHIELLTGSWFEPVVGRKFDRIVGNPPFVVSDGDVDLVYRDSTFDLDGATAHILANVKDYLANDGTAHFLGAWVHVQGQSWQSRIASWLPSEGVEAWIVQRDVADPAQYVGTWLRDESLDPRSAEGQEKATRWLEHFARAGVDGIGFGYITIQKIDGPSSVVCEEMPQPLYGPFHLEASEYLERMAWLRDKDASAILNESFSVRDSAVVDRVSPAHIGFSSSAADWTPTTTISRVDGPAWSHEIDETVATILNALLPDANLATTINVMDMLGAFDDADVEEIKANLVPIIVDLMRHGIVLPSACLSGPGKD